MYAPLGYHGFINDKQAGWFAFGRNHMGQLGLGHRDDQQTPQRVPQEGMTILEITGGFTFTVILDITGIVFAAGALGNESSSFSVVEGLPPIRSVASGVNHALAIDVNGILWALPRPASSFGRPCPTVQQVADLPPVLRVSCGFWFTIVEVHGGLLAFGRNEKGRLGTAAGDNDVVAQEVPVPDGLQWPLRSLACGYDFFVAVDHAGTTWTGGSPARGQLGRPGGSELAPVVAPPMANVTVGYHHCIGVTEDGAAWGWGSNCENQLSGTSNKSKPEVISLPHQCTVAQVRASRESSFVITTDGDLYAVGHNLHGELGLGDTVRRFDWTLHPLRPAFTYKSAAKSARSARPAGSPTS